MPLLMCPNCHGGMKQINREGVQFDMCPECHGVWLDRGELQKLLEASAADPAEAPQATLPATPQPAPVAAQQQAYAPPPQPPYGGAAPGYPLPPGYPPQQAYPPQPGWHRQHDDSDDDFYKRGGKYYGKPYRKKSAMERIFDIFD